MGGDTFEGVEKLTNQQFQVMVPELIKKLSPICQKIQSYIPLPEKQIHGDIDFLVILKPEFHPSDIIEILKLDRYKNNQNQTINSVVNNKQVDFFFPETQKHFETARFYKSYSGIGAFLGVFLPSKEIKLTTQGLFAIGYEKHIKFEYLISDSIPQILQFYGLDYQSYQKGFKTRVQLFEYIRKCRFLNEENFVAHDLKHASKITKFFVEYLLNNEIRKQDQQEITKFEKVREKTLEYFNKEKKFEESFQQKLNQIKKRKDVNDKFNATHVLDRYKITGKEFSKYKKEFREMFETEQNYFEYVQKNTTEEIIQDFVIKCNIKDPEIKEEEEKKEVETKIQ